MKQTRRPETFPYVAVYLETVSGRTGYIEYDARPERVLDRARVLRNYVGGTGHDSLTGAMKDLATWERR